MKNVDGYSKDVSIIQRQINNSVSIAEQETNVIFMRDENFATVYTSDSTQITRLDKLCVTSPEYYTCMSDTGRGKIYRISDKTLLSFRVKKRVMTDEQKRIAGDRMKKYMHDKN